VITSTGVGGTYDLVARLIARHMTRNIPGHPTMIVQNMPGGGNVLATNYMYNIAPKDGTVIATIHSAMPLHQVLDGRGVRYDADKFNWLGSTPSLVDKSTPMRRIRSPCCARAASGHATAAPPSAASNPRRPMVTVIRPSRARCVKGTIPH